MLTVVRSVVSHYHVGLTTNHGHHERLLQRVCCGHQASRSGQHCDESRPQGRTGCLSSHHGTNANWLSNQQRTSQNNGTQNCGAGPSVGHTAGHQTNLTDPKGPPRHTHSPSASTTRECTPGCRQRHPNRADRCVVSRGRPAGRS